MKQYAKLFSLAVLCSAATVMLQADDNNNSGNRVLPFLQWRSQGRDNARKLYGTTSWAVYQPDMDGTYGTFNITVQYDQSFRNDEITRALFGPALIENVNVTTGTGTTTTTNRCNDSCSDTTIIISGLNAPLATGATARGPREIMAENLLLPRTFKSAISFSPKVQDVVVDFNLFVGLDRWRNGLYFRLYGPVVWNRVTLNPSETSLNTVVASTVVAGQVTALGGGYEQGFFDPLAKVPTQALFPNALSYFGGCPFPDKYNVATVFEGSSTVTVQPLRFAKFSDCPVAGTNPCDDDCNSFRRHKTGFAELRGELGYNYMGERSRFLINLQAAAPTGSKIKSEFLFPAYVGNGHHWELGVGLGGAWKMWGSEDDERSFNFIVEADITHLFKAKQQRTFDLKCKPLSRYMLAEKLLSNTDLDETSQLIAPSDGGFQFSVSDLTATPAVPAGEYAPVANFSTRNVKVSIGVQGDLVAMFNYTCRGFSWDLGYNFWAMSSSKIDLSCDDDCNDSCNPVVVPFPEKTWALKGDASVTGYATIATDNFIVGLGATESKATIFGGTGTGLNVANANIDTPVAAVFNPSGADPAVPVNLTAFGTTTNINTSVPVVFISINDLDLEGAEQRGLSHKIFTHLSYAWRDCSDRWVPYVGAGVSAEFGSHTGHDDCPTTTTTTPDCNTCPSSLSWALSKWAVEIKGGVSFH